MKLSAKRITIAEYDLSFSKSVYKNSLDDDTIAFVPDEVFESEQDALSTIEFLMKQYAKSDKGDTSASPLVYPITTDGKDIGYVQAIKLENNNWEIGYHIAKEYRSNGYATEAVQTFIPYILDKPNINEIYAIADERNKPSLRVLEKCGFKEIFRGLADYQQTKRQVVKFIYRT